MPRARGTPRSTSSRSPRRSRRRRAARRRSGRSPRRRADDLGVAAVVPGRRASRRAATSTLPWIHGFQLCTSPSSPSQCQSRRCTNGSSTRGRASCRDAAAEPGVALVERVAEQMVDPRELPDDFTRTQVEEGVVDRGEHGAVACEGVVVRGPTPRALLAQQHDAIGDLVDPALVEGDGRGDGRAAEAMLACEGAAAPRCRGRRRDARGLPRSRAAAATACERPPRPVATGRRWSRRSRRPSRIPDGAIVGGRHGKRASRGLRSAAIAPVAKSASGPSKRLAR